MSNPSKLRSSITRSFCLVILLACFLSGEAHATTEFYVDPTSTNSRRNGSGANPWCVLNPGAWSAINSALAGDDVVIYFSARQAGSEVDEIYASACGGSTPTDIDTARRTDVSPHRLTLDGISFYNTNDASPSWSAYGTVCSPASKACANVRAIGNQNIRHIKYSNLTFNGFRITAGTGKGYTICGDHIVVSNSDVSHKPGVTQGPAVLIVPTSDAERGGSGTYCPVMDDVQIFGNTIHDTFGEGIYIGGGGCKFGGAANAARNGYDDGSGATFSVTSAGGSYTALSIIDAGSGYREGQGLYVLGSLLGGANQRNDLKIRVTGVDRTGRLTSVSVLGGVAVGSASYTNVVSMNNCMGFPAHSNVQVHDNTLYNLGARGAEGDGVDVKGGLVSLRVYNNTIYAIGTAAVQVRCLVTQGKNIADPDPDNRFYNNTCRNISQLLDAAISMSDTWGTPSGVYFFNNLVYDNSDGGGARIYGCVTNCYLVNNVFYNNSGFGIGASAEAVIKNNAVLANNSGGAQVQLGGGAISTNNAYGGTWPGTCTSCQSGLSTRDFVDAAAGNFQLSPTSKLLQAGVDLTSLGIPALRVGAAWNIGAPPRR
jgi:hypothetical protein